MNILIDFTPIPLDRTGVGVYADELLRRLPPLLQSQDRLVVLVQDDDRHLLTALDTFPEICIVRVSATWLRHRGLLFLYEQVVLPFVLKKHKIDVLHSLHYSHPLVSLCANAVTVHDLTYSLYPELHTRFRVWITPFFVKHAMRRSECVIFVSRSTQADAVRVFGDPRFSGSVVPLGVTVSTSIMEMSVETCAGALSRLGISRPFFLFVGTLEPRKNLLGVVAAFERIAARFPEHQLVIAGKLGWHVEAIQRVLQDSPERTRIHRVGFVTEPEKAALLRLCDLLVYPSFYEGFGLPVLEAMAYGVPVVTSNISSLPEVAGDAAVLVDPHSVQSIAEGMACVLDDKDLAERMRRSGRARAQEFTWQRTAEGTLAAYRQAFRIRANRNRRNEGTRES